MADSADRYELRLRLTDAFADAVNNDIKDARLKPLHDVLDKHGASLYSILREFEDFAANTANADSPNEAVRALYQRTVAAIADQGSRFARAFKLVHDGRTSLTESDTTLALERDVAAFASNHPDMIEKLRRTDFPKGGRMHGLFGPDYGMKVTG